MQDFILDHYLIFKSLHIIAFTAWMAGLFYLPRLFVYHCQVAPLSEASEKFKIMEYKLLKIIMNPAMLITWFLGFCMLMANPDLMAGGSFHVKLTFVFILSGFQGFLGKTRKTFAADQNQRPEKFYRIINEIPTLCLFVIVFMVVLKPF